MYLFFLLYEIPISQRNLLLTVAQKLWRKQHVSKLADAVFPKKILCGVQFTNVLYMLNFHYIVN